MAQHERIRLVGVLSQVRPRHAVEIGAGGSSLLLSRLCRRVTTIEDHPDEWLPSGLGSNDEVEEDFGPDALCRVMTPDVDFVLHDGDHSRAAVKADLDTIAGCAQAT